MGACMGFGSLFSKEAREFWINLEFIKVFVNKKKQQCLFKRFYAGHSFMILNYYS